MGLYDINGNLLEGTGNSVSVKKEKDFVRSINHQGYRVNGAIANTMPAFEDSYKQGYKFIETDIRFTSDNVPVLSHDATWGGLTLAEKAYEEMLTVTQGSGSYQTTIASLDDLIYFCKVHNMHPYLELKEGSVEQVQKAIDVVAKYGMLDNVTWISATLGFLKNVVEIYPKARVGNQGSSTTVGTDSGLASLKTEENEVFVYINYAQISEANCISLVKAGYKVGAFTISNNSLYASYVLPLSKLGVTEFTVDMGNAEDYILENYA